MPAMLAAFPALYFTSKFRWYLPLPEGWQTVTTILFPIAQADFVFHEGGHPIIGLLFFGADFMVTAGGTLMQLAFPLAMLWHFWRTNQRFGIIFAIGWLGYSCCAIAWYCADAIGQNIILITGMDGKEGGMHDWNYMLDTLGLLKYAVGIGQLWFLVGTFLMSFVPAWLTCFALRKLTILAPIPNE